MFRLDGIGHWLISSRATIKDNKRIPRDEWLDSIKEEAQTIVNRWSDEEALVYYWMLNKVKGCSMIGIEQKIAEKFSKLWKELDTKV